MLVEWWGSPRRCDSDGVSRRECDARGRGFDEPDTGRELDSIRERDANGDAYIHGYREADCNGDRNRRADRFRDAGRE